MGHVVVCVLHGDPVLPDWLRDERVTSQLVLVVNDPGPGRYQDLPAVRRLLTNQEPRGFAANVNAAVAEEPDAGVLVLVNFDLEMAADVPERLVACLRPGVAAVAPLLSAADGSPVFSAGSLPTSVKEFTRAAGLRSGRPQELARAVLRRRRGWRERNAGPRVLGPGEYVPFTCTAVPREAWAEVGPLDERFALYAEDIDWGRRAQQAGWDVELVDLGPVVHAERATRSPETDRLYEQSHQRFHDKWGRPDHARWQRRGLLLRKAAGRLSGR